MIRKIIMFFFGLVLLALTVAMLFMASAVYDTGVRETISPYFFQTNELSVMRPGAPVRESEMGETAMREMLIKKYVTEYFYAIPDPNNVEQRTGSYSVMVRMSAPKVLEQWKKGEAIGIQSMSENHMMRTVAIDGEIYKPSDSDYWVVPYVLNTWTKSNDMSVEPQITHGTLLMNVLYEPGIRETTLDIGKYLKNSYNKFGAEYDPAIIFRFQVLDLERQ